MQVKFLVQGSSAEPYEVTFVKTGEEFSAFCTCQAGQNRMSCKHRLNILEGIEKNIVSDNAADVAEVKSWLPGSTLQNELRHVKICEARVKAANRELSDAKKRLAKIMNTPIQYDHDTEATIIK